jgi:hypothetical protein
VGVPAPPTSRPALPATGPTSGCREYRHPENSSGMERAYQNYDQSRRTGPFDATRARRRVRREGSVVMFSIITASCGHLLRNCHRGSRVPPSRLYTTRQVDHCREDNGCPNRPLLHDGSPPCRSLSPLLHWLRVSFVGRTSNFPRPGVRSGPWLFAGPPCC